MPSAPPSARATTSLTIMSPSNAPLIVAAILARLPSCGDGPYYPGARAVGADRRTWGRCATEASVRGAGGGALLRGRGGVRWLRQRRAGADPGLSGGAA